LSKLTVVQTPGNAGPSSRLLLERRRGALFPNSSPIIEILAIPDSSGEEHQRSKKVFEFLTKAKDSASADMKSSIDNWVPKGVPPVGKMFELQLPRVMCNQHEYLGELVESWKGPVANKTDAGKKEFYDKLPEAVTGAMKRLEEKPLGARDEIQANCDLSKDVFKSQRTERYQTQVDVMQAVWTLLPCLTGSHVPQIAD